MNKLFISLVLGTTLNIQAMAPNPNINGTNQYRNAVREYQEEQRRHEPENQYIENDNQDIDLFRIAEIMYVQQQEQRRHQREDLPE
jgi:hypothetical protein